MYESRDYAQAENAYRKALEFSPEDHEIWRDLGLLLDQLNRYSDAEISYKKALDLKPDDGRTLCNLGMLHIHQNRLVEAEIAFGRIVEIDPQASQIWFILGMLWSEDAHKISRAESAFRKALEIDPKDSASLEYLGLLLAKDSKRLEEAEHCLNAAIELDSTAENLEAIAHEIVKKTITPLLPRALSWAQKAQQADPKSVSIQFTLAFALLKLNRKEESLSATRGFIQSIDFVKENLSDVIEFFIELAANGYASETLQIIDASPSQTHLEPLIIGLRKFLKMDVKAPLEIGEVSDDVVKRIQERQSQTKRVKDD